MLLITVPLVELLLSFVSTILILLIEATPTARSAIAASLVVSPLILVMYVSSVWLIELIAVVLSVVDAFESLLMACL